MTFHGTRNVLLNHSENNRWSRRRVYRQKSTAFASGRTDVQFFIKSGRRFVQVYPLFGDTPHSKPRHSGTYMCDEKVR